MAIHPGGPQTSVISNNGRRDTALYWSVCGVGINGENGGRSAKVIDFLHARRRLINEHGTAARGPRSPLLDPIRKTLGAPDIQPLFEAFIRNPEKNLDLMRCLTDHHGIEASAKDIFIALAHLGVERCKQKARETFSPDNWKPAVVHIRAGVDLALAAGDWSMAEQLYLWLDQQAADSGATVPELQRLVLFELAGLLARNSDLDSAIEFFLLCEEFARAAGDTTSLMRTEVSLGQALLDQDKPDQALTKFEQAAKIAEETADLSASAEAHIGIGLSLFNLERAPESLKHFDLAAAAAASSNNTVLSMEAANHSAHALLTLGKTNEAFEAILNAVSLSSSVDNLYLRTSLLYAMFEICLEKDRWGELLLELTSALDRVHETEQFQSLGPLLVLSAKINSERGLLHLALHNLEEAAQIFQALEETERFKEVNEAIEQLRSFIVDPTD